MRFDWRREPRFELNEITFSFSLQSLLSVGCTPKTGYIDFI